jgi:hypothetical protein
MCAISGHFPVSWRISDFDPKQKFGSETSMAGAETLRKFAGARPQGPVTLCEAP